MKLFIPFISLYILCSIRAFEHENQSDSTLQKNYDESLFRVKRGVTKTYENGKSPPTRRKINKVSIDKANAVKRGRSLALANPPEKQQTNNYFFAFPNKDLGKIIGEDGSTPSQPTHDTPPKPQQPITDNFKTAKYFDVARDVGKMRSPFKENDHHTDTSSAVSKQRINDRFTKEPASYESNPEEPTESKYVKTEGDDIGKMVTADEALSGPRSPEKRKPSIHDDINMDSGDPWYDENSEEMRESGSDQDHVSNPWIPDNDKKYLVIGPADKAGKVKSEKEVNVKKPWEFKKNEFLGLGGFDNGFDEPRGLGRDKNSDGPPRFYEEDEHAFGEPPEDYGHEKNSDGPPRYFEEDEHAFGEPPEDYGHDKNPEKPPRYFEENEHAFGEPPDGFGHNPDKPPRYFKEDEHAFGEPPKTKEKYFVSDPTNQAGVLVSENEPLPPAKPIGHHLPESIKSKTVPWTPSSTNQKDNYFKAHPKHHAGTMVSAIDAERQPKDTYRNPAASKHNADYNIEPRTHSAKKAFVVKPDSQVGTLIPDHESGHATPITYDTNGAPNPQDSLEGKSGSGYRAPKPTYTKSPNARSHYGPAWFGVKPNLKLGVVADSRGTPIDKGIAEQFAEITDRYEELAEWKDNINIPSPLVDAYDEACQTEELNALKSHSPIPHISAEKKNMLHYQNDLMMLSFVDKSVEPKNSKEAEEMWDETNLQEPLAGFRLLRQSLGIFTEACGTAGDEDSNVNKVQVFFMHEVLKFFLMLEKYTTSPRTPYLTDTEFKHISNYLMNCQETFTPLKFFRDECEELILAYNKSDNYACTPEFESDFNSKKYDPILDVVWHIFNTVRSVCFENFQENMRMWHRFVLAISDLYNGYMKMRWESSSMGERFYYRLLGPRYKLHLLNIRRCTYTYVKQSKINTMLPRYTYEGSVRYSKNKPHDDKEPERGSGSQNNDGSDGQDAPLDEEEDPLYGDEPTRPAEEPQYDRGEPQYDEPPREEPPAYDDGQSQNPDDAPPAEDYGDDYAY